MSYARTKVLTSASENGVYENASPGNFEITWEEDAVLIHTTASEQEDQFYRLYYDGRKETWQEE